MWRGSEAFFFAPLATLAPCLDAFLLSLLLPTERKNERMNEAAHGVEWAIAEAKALLLEIDSKELGIAAVKGGYE